MEDKLVVASAGAYVVVEGDVMTEVGEVTFCWVEKDGMRVSPYDDIDGATAIAESMNEDDLQYFSELRGDD